MEMIDVAVLGATGTVGQKFITLLDGHPWFRVREVVASSRSAGRPYRDAVRWLQDTPIPLAVADLPVRSLEEKLESTVLFSGLDSSVAGEAELDYAERGHVVISNSRNHRMDERVPLVIPEINQDHLQLLDRQPWPGAIVTNPNCSTMFLAMALAPLHRAFGVEAVQVSTMQAVSGAGYPGLPAMSIMGNVIPHIEGEEEKIETEPLKILGRLGEYGIVPAGMRIGAQCNRVPVVDGHTETVSVKLGSPASLDEVRSALESFRGLPQELNLPSAPLQPLWVFDAPDRPQPARDLPVEKGMATLVGRLRECPVLDYRMVLLGHNTIRGAAGAAILNAEAMVALGYLRNGAFHREACRGDSCVEEVLAH
ncbi:MAG: aspartate-semialdehyde dehydrogenase [Spirochaetaceae bacterium]|nr:MAG: aspartate-semialdehyde dehydrogenase [Spirochaetaceae bacterium]